MEVEGSNMAISDVSYELRRRREKETLGQGVFGAEEQFFRL